MNLTLEQNGLSGQNLTLAMKLTLERLSTSMLEQNWLSTLMLEQNWLLLTLEENLTRLSTLMR